MQQDLVSLITWSSSNELYFQPTKCSNLRISGKRISPCRSNSINSIDVDVVLTEKDLGVVIVNDTSWKDHILVIVAKITHSLTHCQLCPLARRAATKLFHFCLSVASCWILFQLSFKPLNSVSTVRRHVFLDLLRLRLPSGVQYSASFVTGLKQILVGNGQKMRSVFR